MTDLWLHVNTFFIIVLIFFGYGSHIKKYMAVYFICLFKLTLCSDNTIKFVNLFLFVFLPGTVKAAPAKLCAVFLCTLLKRLRFSPQNVGFGTKDYPFRLLPLVAATFPKGAAEPSQSSLRDASSPERGSFWHGDIVSSSSAKFPGAPEAPSQRELAKPSGFV